MNAPTLFSYLSPENAASICKLAEAEPQKKPSALKPILAGVLGMGAGTLAGAGSAHLANKAYKHFKGQNIPLPYLAAAAPIIGGALGLAYNLAQAHQIEELRRAAEHPDHKSDGRVP